MKKKLAILFILASLSASSFAQVKEGNNFEIGGGYNFTNGPNSDGNRYSLSGPGAYFEYRYEDKSHFCAGGHINYKYAWGESYDYSPEGLKYSASYHQMSLKALMGYTFLHKSIVNPFVGIEAGLGGTMTDLYTNGKTLNFFWVFTPRAGVQLWRFRFTCDLDLLCKSRRGIWFSSGSYRPSGTAYSTFATNVSLTLGYRF